MSKVLILRPEPGAGETAARARALGLEAVTAPLFTVRPLPWTPPGGEFDAVLLTSANAARHGGAGLAGLLATPCHCVGEATARAARAAGFAAVTAGPGDGAAALAGLAAAGAARVLHLCGRDHVRLAHPRVAIVRRAVYASDALDALPAAAAAALADGALVLLHSPRAAAAFAALATGRQRIRIAAISAAAAAAAGDGWRTADVAPRPRDHALLELAARLCKTDGEETRRG